jgi:hypothetical protein
MASLLRTPAARGRTQCTPVDLHDRSTDASPLPSGQIEQDGPMVDDVAVKELGEAQTFVVNTPLCSVGTSPPLLTPVSRAQVAENATVTTLPRYDQLLSGVRLYDSISPISSASPTRYNIRSPSPGLDNSITGHPFASLRWRLASGYFACFVIGWADGGTFSVLLARHMNSSRHLSPQSPEPSCLVSVASISIER